ncbi:hypothetical protein RhiirA1_530048 [Rhizophagus irregularis]|uniref:Uncharacterized protein n=1 Tax=Rhizophagus irregularis TaxID=588596 RepID=A0A2I1EK02_9GLOM|nr:hypothetical protein RhiirA1_530048 [Rhizophagus irregularis]PKY22449.1 hypothetical protein RhiirB3_525793 [Rhizophagus irregularis]
MYVSFEILYKPMNDKLFYRIKITNIRTVIFEISILRLFTRDNLQIFKNDPVTFKKKNLNTRYINN